MLLYFSVGMPNPEMPPNQENHLYPVMFRITSNKRNISEKLTNEYENITRGIVDLIGQGLGLEEGNGEAILEAWEGHLNGKQSEPWKYKPVIFCKHRKSSKYPLVVNLLTGQLNDSNNIKNKANLIYTLLMGYGINPEDIEMKLITPGSSVEKTSTLSYSGSALNTLLEPIEVNNTTQILHNPHPPEFPEPIEEFKRGIKKKLSIDDIPHPETKGYIPPGSSLTDVLNSSMEGDGYNKVKVRFCFDLAVHSLYDHLSLSKGQEASLERVLKTFAVLQYNPPKDGIIDLNNSEIDFKNLIISEKKKVDKSQRENIEGIWTDYLTKGKLKKIKNMGDNIFWGYNFNRGRDGTFYVELFSKTALGDIETIKDKVMNMCWALEANKGTVPENVRLQLYLYTSAEKYKEFSFKYTKGRFVLSEPQPPKIIDPPPMDEIEEKLDELTQVAEKKSAEKAAQKQLDLEQFEETMEGITTPEIDNGKIDLQETNYKLGSLEFMATVDSRFNKILIVDPDGPVSIKGYSEELYEGLQNKGAKLFFTERKDVLAVPCLIGNTKDTAKDLLDLLEAVDAHSAVELYHVQQDIQGNFTYKRIKRSEDNEIILGNTFNSIPTDQGNNRIIQDRILDVLQEKKD